MAPWTPFVILIGTGIAALLGTFSHGYVRPDQIAVITRDDGETRIVDGVRHGGATFTYLRWSEKYTLVPMTQRFTSIVVNTRTQDGVAMRLTVSASWYVDRENVEKFVYYNKTVRDFDRDTMAVSLESVAHQRITQLTEAQIRKDRPVVNDMLRRDLETSPRMNYVRIMAVVLESII